MTPLSIFSGIAGLVLSSGILYGAISAVQYGVRLIEQRQALKIQTIQLELAAEYRRETHLLSESHAAQLALKNAEIDRVTAEYLQEIDGLKEQLEQRSIVAPVQAGDDFERRLAHRMCLIAAGGDRDSRETCDRRAANPYAPNKSLVVTITPETAERWREECDDGRLDTCQYAIIGFTTEGAVQLLSWLADVDRYQVQLNDYVVNQNAVLKELSE